MTVSLIQWYPDILPDIPNLPIPALMEAVRSAAITFCEKTHLWKITLTDIDIVEDQQDYTLTVPAAQYGEIISVDNVKYRDDGEDADSFQTVDPVSEVQEEKNRSGGWKNYDMGKLEYFVDPVAKTTLTFVGIPQDDSTSGLRVTVIAKPLKTATVLADFLYNDHREDIAMGAKANLFIRKGMPWFDLKMYQFWDSKFLDKCGNGKLRRVRGATNKDLSIKMRPLA